MKIAKILIAAFLILPTFNNNNKVDIEIVNPVVKTSYKEEKKNNDIIDLLVSEDAHIRNGKNAGKNFDYEDITSAHGQDYVGKGYRVNNVRYSGTDEIITVMKFELPTLSEIETKGIDTFEFEFNIFKNLKPNVGNQGYVFHYTTDFNWSETSIQWNSKPESVNRTNAQELFSFYIQRGDEYEFKTDSDKRIRRDITTVIMDLINNEVSEITVFVTAKYSIDTGLMIHTKESEAQNKRTKIVGSNQEINLNSLVELIEAFENVESGHYTEKSYTEFLNKYELARTAVEQQSQDIELINKAYHDLINRFESLEKIHVNAKNDMEKRIYNEGEEGSLPYRLYVPKNYDPNKQYPVVVFLHGAGERGNNNEKQLNNAIQTLFDTQERFKEAIVIAPQCPEDERWVETDWRLGNFDSDSVTEVHLKSVMGILEDIQSEFSVDNDSIYAFGLSMGGFGTWDLITRHSDVFAAAIPICGGADENKAMVLKDIPIWTFHGTNDPTVPYESTLGMYNAIKDVGGEKIIFTTYDGANHLIWETAAAEEGLIDWLFSHKLSDRTINKNTLIELVREYQELLDSKVYTTSSSLLLQTRIDTANDLLGTVGSTEEMYQTAIESLVEAKELLVVKGDVTELIKLIEDVLSLYKTDYTIDSWNILQSSLKEAQDLVAEYDDASEDAVSSAMDKLSESFASLEQMPLDASKLESLVIEAKTKKEVDYTAATWSVFKEKLNVAEDLLAQLRTRRVIKQSEVDKVTDDLNTAMSNLKLTSKEPDTGVYLNQMTFWWIITISSIVLLIEMKKRKMSK